MSSDPPPTLPTGVSMPPRCVHGGHPDFCSFCKLDDELGVIPEPLDPALRPHDFGCPLYDNEAWGEESFARANYRRIYGGDSKCNCRQPPKQPEKKESK